MIIRTRFLAAAILLATAAAGTRAQTEVVNPAGESLNVKITNAIAAPVPIFGGVWIANFPGTAVSVDVQNQPAVQAIEDVDRPANGIYQHSVSMSMQAGSTSVLFTYPDVSAGTALVVEYVSVRLPPSVPQTGTADCLLRMATASGGVNFMLPVRVTPGGGILRPIVTASVTGYHTQTAVSPFISCSFSASMSLDNASATLVGHVVDL